MKLHSQALTITFSLAICLAAYAYSAFNRHNRTVEETHIADISKLNTEDAIGIRTGYKRSIYIFEQPDCFYCEKLQPELAKLENVNIYIFLLPGHSDKTRATAHSVWCAENKVSAFEELMKGSDLHDPKPGCTSEILDRNHALAKSYGLTGTPAIVMQNGTAITGFTTADALAKFY